MAQSHSRPIIADRSLLCLLENVQRLFSIIYLFFSIYSFVRCFRQSTCVSNVFILLLRHGTGTSPNEPIAELFLAGYCAKRPIQVFLQGNICFCIMCYFSVFFSHCFFVPFLLLYDFMYFFYLCSMCCSLFYVLMCVCLIILNLLDLTCVLASVDFEIS